VENIQMELKQKLIAATIFLVAATSALEGSAYAQ